MINYTKLMFGQALKNLVLQKLDIVEISIWAHSTYLECSEQVDAHLLQVILDLSKMELGEQFALSYEILGKIADDLIAGKDVDLNSAEYRE